MRRMLLFLLCLPLCGQHILFLAPNGKTNWARLGTSISIVSTTPYPTLECAAGVPNRAPVTYSLSVAAGQVTFSIPASETANPRWLMVAYAVVMVEGEDYTVSTNKRTVTFTRTVPTPGGIVQLIAVF